MLCVTTSIFILVFAELLYLATQGDVYQVFVGTAAYVPLSFSEVYAKVFVATVQFWSSSSGIFPPPMGQLALQIEVLGQEMSAGIP